MKISSHFSKFKEFFANKKANMQEWADKNAKHISLINRLFLKPNYGVTRFIRIDNKSSSGGQATVLGNRKGRAEALP